MLKRCNSKKQDNCRSDEEIDEWRNTVFLHRYYATAKFDENAYGEVNTIIKNELKYDFEILSGDKLISEAIVVQKHILDSEE